MLVIDLLGDQRVPEDPRHRPEQCARVGAERPGLDQRDADATTQLQRPVDRIVDGHARRAPQPPGLRPLAKSRWNAEAVGSDWPWYFDPRSFDPYGRSTGLDILKNEIWPIFMPW